MAEGIDRLRLLSSSYALDLRHVVLVGHSAGGHLALWAAARGHLPKASLLHQPNPLLVAGVLSLAGIADLEAYRRAGPSACGGPATIDALVGRSSAAHRDVFADTSPARLLPLGVRYALISGGLDGIVPASFAAEIKSAFTGRANSRRIPLPGDAAVRDLVDWQWLRGRRARVPSVCRASGPSPHSLLLR